jgi:Mlc titration factor MtfA (ptsG expression regulator)
MAGLIGWLHRRKRARRAIPESWLAILNEHVSFYRRLPDEDLIRFLQLNSLL